MSATSFRSPARANKKNGHGPGAFLITLAVLAAIVIVLGIVAGIYTQVSWFNQLGAVRVFWTQWGWSIALGAIGIVLVTLVTWWGLRLGRRGARAGAPDAGAGVRVAITHHPFLMNWGVPLVAGVLFGTPLFGNWQTFVTWFYRTPFGTEDPQFGKDISFYVFSLPALQALLSFVMTLLILSALAAVASHMVWGGIERSGSTVHLLKRARMDFGVYAALLSLVAAGYFWLRRYEMLLSDNANFSGAPYADIKASLPGITVLAIACIFIAALFIVSAIRGSWRLAMTGVAVLVVAALVVSWAWPALVQQFRVTPNAIETESPYIQRNIDATRTAYGLDNVETIPYNANTTAEAGALRGDAESTAQIRLLDPNIVSPTFSQLQQNKQFYKFAQDLTVDRYNLDGKDRDTVIAVRELNLDGLGANQRSWVNDHTVYTHGYGVVAAYGNTTDSGGAPAFYEKGIPSTGLLGGYEPRVYFGQESPTYSIVGAPESRDPWELDYPDDGAPSGQRYSTYDGDGGPSIGNLFERLMYAINFRSTDIFFSDRVTSESQILFDRDPHVRAQKVAPYLTLDSKAYPAVVDTDGDPKTPKRLVWIIDGYTTSNSYPYSARQSLDTATTDTQTATDPYQQDNEQVNYIRNSVKVTVDAYDGKVTLYQWDAKDPVLKAWSKVFPGSLTPVSEMSGDLMAHVRYPEDLFKVQRSLLTKYHVTDAASFYSGGDFWAVPNEPTAATNEQGTDQASVATPQPPYYLTLQTPGQESAEFSLSTSFIPGGQTNRNIMTGFLAVDSNAGSAAGKVREGYGKLRLLELPRDLTVPGPGQAQNNFVSNQRVSTAINLLRQGGTTVNMGNLLTLPVGGGMLYVQPVYVQASQGTTFPLMQYVLTAFGTDETIGFAPTLEEALNQTFGGNSGATAGDANVEGQKEDPVTSGTTPSSGATASPSSEATASASAEASASPSAAAPSTTPNAGASGSASDAQTRLDTALQSMRDANNAADAAMKKGDWVALGEAQQKLSTALNDALAAQDELKK